jgi:hypothetical protein
LNASDTGEKAVYNYIVYQLFQKAYDSVRREELYNIVIEFVASMNLVRQIKRL